MTERSSAHNIGYRFWSDLLHLIRTARTNITTGR